MKTDQVPHDSDLLFTYYQRRMTLEGESWRRSIEKERSEAGWKSWEEARIIARDWDRWKRSIKALCATEHEED